MIIVCSALQSAVTASASNSQPQSPSHAGATPVTGMEVLSAAVPARPLDNTVGQVHSHTVQHAAAPPSGYREAIGDARAQMVRVSQALDRLLSMEQKLTRVGCLLFAVTTPQARAEILCICHQMLPWLSTVVQNAQVASGAPPQTLRAHTQPSLDSRGYELQEIVILSFHCWLSKLTVFFSKCIAGILKQTDCCTLCTKQISWMLNCRASSVTAASSRPLSSIRLRGGRMRVGLCKRRSQYHCQDHSRPAEPN